MTFLFFPATVYTAYVADRRLFCYKYMSKSYRMNKHGIVVQSEKAGNDIESRAQEKFKVKFRFSKKDTKFETISRMI